ncbi:MAG TPA: hypothetical protein VF485_10470 [Sphingomonas sp.]
MAARQNPADQPEDVDTDDLVIATVAFGRTLITDDGRKGPGEEVMLPAADVETLTRLGFLVDPDAEPIKEASGPTFERR